MFAWLISNLATVVIGLILLVVVVLIVWKLLKDRKAGKHICGGSCGSCGGGCSGCPMHGQCGKA